MLQTPQHVGELSHLYHAVREPGKDLIGKGIIGALPVTEPKVLPEAGIKQSRNHGWAADNPQHAVLGNTDPINQYR